MAECSIINCVKKNIESEIWCRYHLVKSQTHNNLVPCSFCHQIKVPTNKNFYICHRYQAQFWNTKYPITNFICFDCLYDVGEITIMRSKQAVYRTYKWRYYQQYRTKSSK